MGEESEVLTNKITVPEIKIDKISLYHGSNVSGISEFRRAEETTIGKGLYLTSSIEAARGYAERRSKILQGSTPTVYGVEARNVRLADLRTKEGVIVFSKLLAEELVQQLQDSKYKKWYIEAAMQKTLQIIRDSSFKSLKDIAWHHQDLVTQVLERNGFDGLVSLEGGEGEDVKEHDSYVLFDPKKAKIVKETSPKLE